MPGLTSTTAAGISGKVPPCIMPGGQAKAASRLATRDGEVRLVSKTATFWPRSANAEDRADRPRAPGETGLPTGGTGVSTLAETWLAADRGWSTRTERTHRLTVREQVLPAFGRLCPRAITPPGHGQAGADRDRQKHVGGQPPDPLRRGAVVVGHSHAFRKPSSPAWTTPVPLSQVAIQCAANPSMTWDVYSGRQVISVRAARVVAADRIDADEIFGRGNKVLSWRP